MPRKKKPKPDAEPEWGIYACPGCGRSGDSDLFDCGGAAFGCLWCNQCGTHFDSVTGKLVPVVVAGETGVLFR